MVWFSPGEKHWHGSDAEHGDNKYQPFWNSSTARAVTGWKESPMSNIGNESADESSGELKEQCLMLSPNGEKPRGGGCLGRCWLQMVVNLRGIFVVLKSRN
jgi:hypothetical protein